MKFDQLRILMQSSDTAEIVEALEDSQMTLASLAASRFAAPFREEVTAWLSKLASVSEQVHRTCISLEVVSLVVQIISSILAVPKKPVIVLRTLKLIYSVDKQRIELDS